MAKELWHGNCKLLFGNVTEEGFVLRARAGVTKEGFVLRAGVTKDNYIKVTCVDYKELGGYIGSIRRKTRNTTNMGIRDWVYNNEYRKLKAPPIVDSWIGTEDFMKKVDKILKPRATISGGCGLTDQSIILKHITKLLVSGRITLKVYTETLEMLSQIECNVKS